MLSYINSNMNEHNLTQRKFYVLIHRNDNTDPCVSYIPGTQKDNSELKNGISKAAMWKEKMVLKLNDDSRGSK